MNSFGENGLIFKFDFPQSSATLFPRHFLLLEGKSLGTKFIKEAFICAIRSQLKIGFTVTGLYFGVVRQGNVFVGLKNAKKYYKEETAKRAIKG